MVEADRSFEIQVPDTFEFFYREDYPAVVALTYGLSGSRWVAEDLTQEAFLRAHRDWARVREMDSPGGWVRHVALNLARSRLRRLRSEALYRSRIRPSTETSSAPSEPESEAFWEEVRRLPTRQAQTMALRYIDDLSVTQIAGVMGVAEGTVKALLHQGRERLRRQLIAKGYIDDEV